MKAFATLLALIAIALAITLGLNQRAESQHDSEQAQALQAAEGQVQYAREQAQKAQDQLRVHQAELDATRNLLAQSKTLESGLRLQLAESELKIRQLSEQLTQQQQAYQTLEKLHREVKNELVQLHTSSAPSTLTQNRLRQYEQEIADLQRQLRDQKASGEKAD